MIKNWFIPICVGIVFSLTVLGAPVPSRAAETGERFTSVDTQMNIDTDGMLSVRHKIKVVASGRNVKRGIYLQIPSFIGPVSEMQVTRNGISEPFTLDGSWGPTLRTGDKDVEIEPGEQAYVIRYWARKPMVERTIRGTKVEVLDWRPLMDDARLPWVTSRLQITWPRGMAPREIGTGTTKVWRWRGPAGLTADGEPYRGTVSLSWWPIGTFSSTAVRRWYVNNMLRFGMPAGLILFWMVLHFAWYRVGRDRRPVIITTVPKPPDGISPGAASYLLEMGPAKTSAAASLMGLAVKRALDIQKNGRTLHLTIKDDKEEAPASADEQALLAKLFAERTELDLKGKTAQISKGIAAQSKALHNQFRGRMFKNNVGTWSQCMLLILMLVAFGVWEVARPGSTASGDTFAVAIAIGCVATAFIVGLVYLGFFKAPTRDGRKAMDGVEGLRQFMTQEHVFVGSDAHPSHFFELLPYAVALGAEREWMARFGLSLDETNDPDTKDLLEWYRTFTRDKDGADSLTFSGIALPAMTGNLRLLS